MGSVTLLVTKTITNPSAAYPTGSAHPQTVETVLMVCIGYKLVFHKSYEYAVTHIICQTTIWKCRAVAAIAILKTQRHCVICSRMCVYVHVRTYVYVYTYMYMYTKRDIQRGIRIRRDTYVRILIDTTIAVWRIRLTRFRSRRIYVSCARYICIHSHNAVWKHMMWCVIHM